jgi:anaphase-promoting complex subunit 2
MSAAIMAKADATFFPSFSKWFRYSLEWRQYKQQQAMDESTDHSKEDISQQFDLTEDDERIFFYSLRRLKWIRAGDGLLSQTIGEVLHDTILSWMKKTISGEFEADGLFDAAQQYKDDIILPWLHDLVDDGELEEDCWKSWVDYTVAQCFCLVRMDEMFELVTDFPDSLAAVRELKQVLEITRMHHTIARALKTALIRRLNHPGANTTTIIDVYINTIKVFREIDPSDRLLQIVAEPVRSYLRQRQNTVRCIITSLTDSEAGGDLYDELRRQDAKPLEELHDDSDDEDDPPDMNWQPPPPLNKERGSFLASSGVKDGGGDILAMLVSIYGSKDLFVNEFRLMLADKLLANETFNTDQDVHTLELLKLRFGEVSMRNCEIMIKDIDDSKRVVTNIHQTIKSKQAASFMPRTGLTTKTDPRVDAAIVSGVFWPTLKKEPFKHHPRIQTELDQFSSEYGRLKNPRRLIWINQLGSVHLDLDVIETRHDGTPVVETKEFKVSPLLATLISYFEDKDEWTSEDLANEVGVPEHIVQKKMFFWINNHVIRLLSGGSPMRYGVATHEHMLHGGNKFGDKTAGMMGDDGIDNLVISAAAQEEEEMEVYESYIVGMLTNLGQLSLDRIHSLLKTYVSGGSEVKYSKTPQQLGQFLQQLCRREKIERGPDGMYKLFKN